MKKRNSMRKENKTMDEIRVFGYCTCCENKITDEIDEYYINSDGEIFCSVECCLEHYSIVKLEV